MPRLFEYCVVLAFAAATAASAGYARERGSPEPRDSSAASQPISEELDARPGKGGKAGVQARARALPERVDGRVYTWRDGRRTRKAIVQPNLSLHRDGVKVSTDGEKFLDLGGGARIVAKRGAADTGLAVFRSEAGDLMALPGGVLLVLDPHWERPRVDAFLAANGIDSGRLSELAWADNAFLVKTAPGFAALELANALAGRDGVVLSSPNWWTESTLK